MRDFRGEKKEQRIKLSESCELMLRPLSTVHLFDCCRINERSRRKKSRYSTRGWRPGLFALRSISYHSFALSNITQALCIQAVIYQLLSQPGSGVSQEALAEREKPGV